MISPGVNKNRTEKFPFRNRRHLDEPDDVIDRVQQAAGLLGIGRPTVELKIQNVSEKNKIATLVSFPISWLSARPTGTSFLLKDHILRPKEVHFEP